MKKTRYYREDADGILIAVGTGGGNTEITEAKYNEIVEMIKSRPKDGEGFEYVLLSSLEWEKRAVTPVSTEISDKVALEIILGGGSL